MYDPEVGYCQGSLFIAGILLMNVSHICPYFKIYVHAYFLLYMYMYVHCFYRCHVFFTFFSPPSFAIFPLFF